MNVNQAPEAARTLLVAGAEGYLGFQAVRYFAGRGLAVVASCRTRAEAARVQAQWTAESSGNQVRVVTCDLADEAQVKATVAEAVGTLGTLDALFNAAGGFRWAPTTDLTSADFDFLFAANLRSSWLLAKHAAPVMRARGFGRMVFVSARGTLAPVEPGLGLYIASKAALNALVGGLAAELKDAGVRVNAVLPTVLDTPANRLAMPDVDPRRWVPSDALLDIVAMLLGPAGAAMNGALVPVAGGL
jgi:NAD(P)-dependent dehydrogenase (short-subunit alcohol dehydrogenase family)